MEDLYAGIGILMVGITGVLYVSIIINTHNLPKAIGGWVNKLVSHLVTAFGIYVWCTLIGLSTNDSYIIHGTSGFMSLGAAWFVAYIINAVARITHDIRTKYE